MLYKVNLYCILLKYISNIKYNIKHIVVIVVILTVMIAVII